MSNPSTTDATLPNASQTYAWEALGPCFIGWIVELLVTGACIQKSCQFFSRRSTLSKQMKYILAAVLFFNGIVCGTAISEILLWGTAQQRDEASLWEFKIPDAYMPIPAGLTSLVVQSFFAARAWKICNKSTLFLAYIGILIMATLAGSCGLGILQVFNLSGYTAEIEQVILVEIWTWAAALTDLSISVVIVFALYREKTGYDMPTDSVVMKIIHATMESASMTSFLAIVGAITSVAFWTNESISPDTIFLYPLPAVYTLSLLWCLRTTDHVRKEQQNTYSNTSSAFYGDQFNSNSDSTTGTGGGGGGCNARYMGSTYIGSVSSRLDMKVESDVLIKDRRELMFGVGGVGGRNGDGQMNGSEDDWR